MDWMRLPFARPGTGRVGWDGDICQPVEHGEAGLFAGRRLRAERSVADRRQDLRDGSGVPFVPDQWSGGQT